jgi:hypothetical protein
MRNGLKIKSDGFVSQHRYELYKLEQAQRKASDEEF